MLYDPIFELIFSSSYAIINNTNYYSRDYGEIIFAGSMCATQTINYTTNTIESAQCDKILVQTTSG